MALIILIIPVQYLVLILILTWTLKPSESRETVSWSFEDRPHCNINRGRGRKRFHCGVKRSIPRPNSCFCVSLGHFVWFSLNWLLSAQIQKHPLVTRCASAWPHCKELTSCVILRGFLHRQIVFSLFQKQALDETGSNNCRSCGFAIT